LASTFLKSPWLKYLFQLLVVLGGVTLGLRYLGDDHASHDHGPAGDSSGGATVPADAKQILDFAFTDQSGKTVTLADFHDKVWVADLIFTSCGDTCPLMTRAMRRVQDELQSEDDIRFLSISVDPDTDTIDKLAQYAAQHGADPKRWYFVRGPIETVIGFAKNAFQVGLGGTPDLHSTRFVLVDRRAQVRGYFDGTSAKAMDELKAAARELLGEAPVAYDSGS
jgi:protein SCO1/2